MKKIFPLGAIALLMCSLITACQQASAIKPPKKPNVIIVITDDQGYGDLGHTGNKIIKTPTIDTFSSQGINLTNYHVGTTCAPTRAGLMTGRNCNRNGVWHTIMGASMLNKEEVTMANVFKDNGYKTAMFGKWHLGDNHPFVPYERGFDETFYHGGGGVGQTPDYWNNDYFDDTYFRNGVPEKVEGYCTDVWFDEAIKFIEAKKDDNFFCYLSLNAPHSPFNVPEKYYDIYKDENDILEAQKRFYGMITNIDDNFSKLLNKLDRLGIADNTIVIYTTDNGTSFGYKYDKKNKTYKGYNAGMRGTKSSQYEGGHRVPFILRWPAGELIGGKSYDALTAHVDMLPTLAKLAGIEHRSVKKLDGTDLSEYLSGKANSTERYLVTDTQRVPWPIKGRKSCVMNTEWRLINGKELYNIVSDPGQKNDLAKAHPKRVKEMQDFYNTWWDSVIKESKLSTIELGIDTKEVLTCHDARLKEGSPAWNQKFIRQGKHMPPSHYAVNFTKAGKYTFHLSRWPEEANLSLSAAINDEKKGTKTRDAIVHGRSISYKKAYLEIGNQKVMATIDNNKNAVSFELDIPAGKTELLAYFELPDASQEIAYYVTVTH